uniref:Uncharacterized protein n=1 Tax=Rhizophora mucronata TaxID=61149 RepID=A0A2P2Q7X8_RHIMU
MPDIFAKQKKLPLELICNLKLCTCSCTRLTQFGRL